MSDAQQLHADQVAYWNGAGGENWVAHQPHTDAQLSPVTEVVLRAAAPRPGEHVLDIGCGGGTTTLLLADAVGPAGHVTGLDVSAPMLDAARRRGGDRPNLAWLLADAATHRFTAAHDLLFSRFGVMFFGDPVAGFANLRTALRPGGRIVFVCWRPFEENPWMRVPLHAAYAAGVPRLPRPGPEDPGPFAFADPERVRRIFREAGWPAPSMAAVDVQLDLGAGGGLERAVNQASHIGPTGRALREAPEEARTSAIAAIRQALTPHLSGDSVKLPGAVWVVSSRP